MKERDIERTCSDFLELDGWRSLKTDPVSDRARGKGFGEIGMADRLYIRYGDIELFDRHIGQKEPNDYPWMKCKRWNCEVLWIEFKSAKGKPSLKQLDWHRAERARGALTWIAGVDFPASIEGFMAFYRQSGLLRRQGL